VDRVAGEQSQVTGVPVVVLNELVESSMQNNWLMNLSFRNFWMSFAWPTCVWVVS
jgi:hypothetical protein